MPASVGAKAEFMRLEAELAYLSEIQSKTAAVKPDAPPKRETTKKEKSSAAPPAPTQTPAATSS